MGEALKGFLERNGMKQEKDEVELDTFALTDYPQPVKKFRLILSDHEESLEGMYYWMLEAYKQDAGYNVYKKIIDTFAASEQSSFFGVSQQRLGLQQDKVSQFLQSIGKMVKEMFQFVRELRIIDERLGLYSDSYSSNRKKGESSDIALKGVWIDLVEGGSKNPGSVYGLAREVGFTILPDLFFATRYVPKGTVDKEVNKLSKEDIATMEKLLQEEHDNIDSFVDSNLGEDNSDGSKFNRKVLEVLKRKLKTFQMWKKLTFKELWTRRKFTLQYFRQHFEVIRLYMTWMKPYLRNVRRLQMREEFMDSVDMVGAFEGSMLEVEFLAAREEGEGYYGVGLVNIKYRTRAALSYQQEGFQRGPKHSGRAEITIRAYAWTKEQIDDYEKMRKSEDIELLETLDESLKLAIDALRDDMLKYLGEAGEELYSKDLKRRDKLEEMEKKKEEDERKKQMTNNIFHPFGLIGSQSKEMFGNIKSAFSFSNEAFEKEKKNKARSSAGKSAKGVAFRAFKFYRKAHRLLTY